MAQETEKKEIKREFGLSSLSVNNRTSVIILTLMIAVMGIVSYIQLPKESFPEITIPTIYVGTVYPGNSPVDMENLITRPIEKELKSLNGVKDIKSTSIQDYSTIIVEFNPDVEVSKALQDTKDAVDKAKGELPSDLDRDPNVFEINFSEFPIMYINLSGDFGEEELKEYAEYLEEEIETLPEISKAEIKGAREREIRIDADIYKMEAMQVSFNDIAGAIANENVTMSGGNILADDFRRSLRIKGEFDDIKQLEDVIVKNERGRIIYLKDVASVTDAYEERSSFARSSKLPVLTVTVVKRSGENLLDASDKIKEIIDEAKAERFPEGLDISLSNDQSKKTRDQVSNLENNIIFGVILVVLVLLFFLGTRNSLFVGIAIPMSMFLSFLILSFFGITLNMMVLFALVLALGMLVDNGIVVVENVYRLMEEGYNPIQAAKEGVGEVAWPIITSTATTLAAFLPLAFWGGIMGEFMRYLPITLIIVLSSSLFVALVMNPVFTALFMKLQKDVKVNKKRLMIITAVLFVIAGGFYSLKGMGFYQINGLLWGNMFMVAAMLIPLNVFVFTPLADWFQDSFLPVLENNYHSFVTFALKKPALIFFGTVGLLFFSIFFMVINKPKVAFFPENEPNYINIFIEKPIGTDIESTNAFTKQVEEKVIDMMEPYDYMVESIVAQVGQGASDPSQGPSQSATPNKAMLTVAFLESDKRQGQSTNELLNKVRKEMTKYAGVQITVDKERNGPPVGKPINIEVSGEDFETLIALVEDIKKEINSKGIAGIEELKSDLETGKPELLVNIDREAARRFGLSTGQIANELRTAIFGLEVSKFKDGEDEYPIQLRLADKYRYDVDALMNKKVFFRTNTGQKKHIPISAVADVEYSSTYGSVKRLDLDRVITIFSNVEEGHNANEIVATLKAEMADYEMPEGYAMKFTGEQEEQAKSMSFLMQAFAIAVMLILLIIVAQFNSLGTPFIIMLSVFLSLIGVFLGLTIFQMDFIIIMTMIGIISLAGVVVNNAIVLIDYTNLLRNRRRTELGMEEDELLPMEENIKSIIEAGKTRLRPVLLTAITTVLGLVPMALGVNINFMTMFTEFDPQFYVGGDNAAFWGPMASTVIFGLIFATFLTLVVVPVMYMFRDQLKMKLKKA